MRLCGKAAGSAQERIVLRIGAVHCLPSPSIRLTRVKEVCGDCGQGDLFSPSFSCTLQAQLSVLSFS